MFMNWLKSRKAAALALQNELVDLRGQRDAVRKSQAVIEFKLDGTILWANDHFCTALGYTLEEIQGQHHRIFTEPAYAQSAEYRDFWAKLQRGEYDARQYKRIAKGGREVWIQASYNPIFDAQGKPVKVMKMATDITEQKVRNADFEGQLTAINRGQAVIEFKLDGTILSANENFCRAVGYAQAEVLGRHHRMFVDTSYANSADYQDFWARLNRGEFMAARYKRIGKGGREVWIQATYNPIMDLNGKPWKIVKYATDVTAEGQAALVLEHAVEQMQAAVTAARAGDLTRRITTSGTSGAIFDLCTGVNTLLDSMVAMVRSVADSSTTITTAASEISSGNADLSRRTEQAASSLQETAASMEELTATVRQNAEHAAEASRLATVALKVATDGGEVVGQVVRTMGEINESSRKIGDIIGVIDGIAFQTNILALNAAVEAARAGEQGRGFAVVASEVRNLAQRSAAAAKEVRGLIEHSVSKVDTGAKLVNHAGTTMTEVVTSIDRVTGIIKDISSASQDQRIGIEQVAQSVTVLEESTQQNAALVEEAAAAAESLLGQAQDMQDMVGAYSLA